VCSAYKFFGPHEGILYGKRQHLDRLAAYKVRPAPDAPPGKWETGTQNHECIAGTLGAIEYFEWLGGKFQNPTSKSQRERIAAGMQVLADYERELGGYLIKGLQSVSGIKVWGITDPQCYNWRVPTVSFTHTGWHPLAVAEYLGRNHINVWDGNYYALEIMERLGLQASGGMVRVGLAHYNTHAEVDRLIETLQRYVP
jgi:selenocysteine lyase/cysteine desulfurase